MMPVRQTTRQTAENWNCSAVLIGLGTETSQPGPEIESPMTGSVGISGTVLKEFIPRGLSRVSNITRCFLECVKYICKHGVAV